MAARAETMPTPVDSQLRFACVILLRPLGAVFLSVILAAAGLAVVHHVNATIGSPILELATTAGLGLVSGFAARWALRHHSGLVRGLAALAALTVGLLLLGLITRGRVGVGPLNLPLRHPDWEGLGQVALASVAAGLAQQAWSRRPGGEQWARPSLAQRVQEAWRRSGARARAQWEASAAYRGLLRVRGWLAQAGAWASATRRAGPTAPRATAPWGALESLGKPVNHPTGNLRDHLNPFRWRAPASGTRRQAHVRLTGVEEHRCPYCLEVVERNDPRGVVVCPTCQTRHHGDCWAVTGMCQVPHHHASSKP